MGADESGRTVDLRVLSQLTALEELWLISRGFEDASSLQVLTTLPKLERLDLGGAELTDECLPILQRIRSPLTSLELSYISQLTGEPASGQHWGVTALPMQLTSCDGLEDTETLPF